MTEGIRFERSDYKFKKNKILFILNYMCWWREAGDRIPVRCQYSSFLLVLQGILVINIFIWVCLWFWKSTTVYSK